MKKPYSTPELYIDEFVPDTMIASAGRDDIIEGSKNPGHHINCTVMPNGKPIPENAVGYWGNHDEP